MMEKKSRKKWIIIGIAGVLVLALVVWVMMPQPLLVQMAQADQGRVRAYVEERARTSLPHVWRLTMPQDGRIMPITIKAGTLVKEGQVVAEMDVADLLTTVQETQDVIAAMASAVKASAAKVTASRAQEQYAQFVRNAQTDLYRKKQISKNAMKAAEKDYIQSQVENSADVFTLEAMKALQAALGLAPSYYNRQLRRAVLKSPINGEVLKRYVSNEMVLQAGTPLLDIGDRDQLEVTADILSDEAVNIRPGNPVEIYGPSIGSEPVHGTVRRVEPQGFVKISSLGVEQLRVPVKIAINAGEMERLQQRGKTLGVDYRVLVRVFTASRDDVVRVPRTALFRGAGGDWELFIVEKGKAQLVKVKVGLTNDTEAEITGGVDRGATVVVAPQSTLTNGTRVKKG